MLFDLTCTSRSGKVRWSRRIFNGVTTEGMNRLLNVSFGGASQIIPYVGLIAQSGYTGLSSSDTHASHAGWNEWIDYSGNRPAWVAQNAAGGVMASLIPFQWVMTASGQLRGAFIASQAAKGTGAGAIIYCTAAATSALTVAVSDTITCTYALTIRE